jgi:ubiquitin-like 1-activating enzyme E1 A
MKAQEKIRNANILVITIKALGNEVAKNLVLAGIGSLTVVDHETVTEADLGSQFFLSAVDNPVGMKRAEAASTAIRKLNPRVKVSVDTENIQSKNPQFYAPFDIVIATDLPAEVLNVINTVTRLNQLPFYAAGCYGLYGFIFADLIEHEFVIETGIPNIPQKLGPETHTRSILAVSPKPGDDTRELRTKRELYSTFILASDGSALPDDIRKSARRRRAVSPILSFLRALWQYPTKSGTGLPAPSPSDHAQLALFTRMCNDKHRALGLPEDTLRADLLRSFLQNVCADPAIGGGAATVEIAPVAAVLGGQLAQDVINVLGQNQQPIQNFVVFDGTTMAADVYPLHPEGMVLGRAQLDPAATIANAADLAGLGMLPPMPLMGLGIGMSMVGNGDGSDLMMEAGALGAIDPATDPAAAAALFAAASAAAGDGSMAMAMDLTQQPAMPGDLGSGADAGAQAAAEAGDNNKNND